MIIAAQSPTDTKPFLEIDNRRTDQVVLRFISRDEHITLHLDDVGQIIKTHYFPDKPSSTWDETNVETARTLGYRNPERHGSYVDHRPLPHIDNIQGYHLVGRLIDLDGIQPRQRYYSNIDQTLVVPSNKFMLNFYLSTPENQRQSQGMVLSTNLGDVCLEL